MADDTFYVWAALISEHAADVLITGLIRKGFKVSSLAESKDMTSGVGVSRLAVLKVEQNGVSRDKSKKAVQWIKHVVEETLKDREYRYYALIVSGDIGENCTWSGCTIELPKKTKTPPSRLERMLDEDEEDRP